MCVSVRCVDFHAILLCSVLALCVGITRWVVVSVVLIGGADFGGVVKAPYKANELGGIGMMATH